MKRSFLYSIGWVLSRTLAIILGMRVYGREHVPTEGPFLLASNHISYLDPPLIGSTLSRQIAYFAKAELFKFGLFGKILRNVHAIPVRRGTTDRQSIDLAIESLQAGYGLNIYPEGTHSPSGELLKPKPGIGMLALRAKVPIVVCYIHGANEPFKSLFKRGNLSVTFSKPIQPEEISDFSEDRTGYMALAHDVMSRLAEMQKQVQTA